MAWGLCTESTTYACFNHRYITVVAFHGKTGLNKQGELKKEIDLTPWSCPVL